MGALDIIRAWKDNMYRDELNEVDRATLPKHPAGEVELFNTELADIKGGTTAPVESWFITSGQIVTACRSE